METWDAIRTRRNVREFDDRPIPAEDLDRIVAAAALAPSSMNEQRWAFVVCREKDRPRGALARGRLRGSRRGGRRRDRVPHPSCGGRRRAREHRVRPRPSRGERDAHRVGAGIGSCHGSVYDEPRVRELLAYPPEMTCDLVVSFGYPADPASLAPPGLPGRAEAPGRSAARGALRGARALRPRRRPQPLPGNRTTPRPAYVWVNREEDFH